MAEFSLPKNSKITKGHFPVKNGGRMRTFKIYRWSRTTTAARAPIPEVDLDACGR